jgi:hypothetical protein
MAYGRADVTLLDSDSLVAQTPASPSSFPSSATSSVSHARSCARVISNFAAEQAGDLSLEVGQIVVLTKAPSAKKWWRGYIKGEDKATKGMFPRACVQVEEISAWSVPKEFNKEPQAHAIKHTLEPVQGPEPEPEPEPEPQPEPQSQSQPQPEPQHVLQVADSMSIGKREALLRRAQCSRDYFTLLAEKGIEDEFIDVLDTQGWQELFESVLQEILPADRDKIIAATRGDSLSEEGHDSPDMLQPYTDSSSTKQSPLILAKFTERGRLGISFDVWYADDPGSTEELVIAGILPGSLAATEPQLVLGLVLVQVQGHNVAGKPPEVVLDCLRQAERPLELGFEARN